ncbi:MAG: cold shock domain-containing protein, partial [Nanoarchaeota archaeon]
CWFNSNLGYGFIEHFIGGVKQEDLFVHFSDISSEGFRTLYKEQKVSYNVGLNKRGLPKATDVIVLKQ